MAGEAKALLLIGTVHVLAVLVLLWMLARAGEGSIGPGWWLHGGGDDDGPPGPEPGAGPPPVAATTRPSDVRLRGPGRLADARPRPPRRPEHDPAPARIPERS